MARKIARKIISQKTAEKVTEEGEAAVPEAPKVSQPEEMDRRKKACFFCQSKISPSYTDVAVLRRFITDRAKIVSSEKSHLCSKHQRITTRQIKYARHLALLPFIPRV